MDVVHLLYPDESGCIYCKKINGLIKIVPLKTPCLSCEKMMGTIQGAGCECAWNDFDFTNAAQAIYDPLAEYDRINNFKKVPKDKRLKLWEHRNRKAYLRYQDSLIEQQSTPAVNEPDTTRRAALITEVEHYCEEFKDYGLEPPIDFPFVGDEELEHWVDVWSEFEP